MTAPLEFLRMLNNAQETTIALAQLARDVHAKISGLEDLEGSRLRTDLFSNIYLAHMPEIVQYTAALDLTAAKDHRLGSKSIRTRLLYKVEPRPRGGVSIPLPKQGFVVEIDMPISVIALPADEAFTIKAYGHTPIKCGIAHAMQHVVNWICLEARRWNSLPVSGSAAHDSRNTELRTS